MENRIVKKVDAYVTDFKNEVKEWFKTNDSEICGKCNKSDFLQFIFDFDGVSLSKDDFQKRKRVKNIVATQIRCCAKRANGEQCTRRKKDDEDYCGTHIKGTPYGKVESDNVKSVLSKKKDIWVQDIKGINYFIDADNNIYEHEDVLSNKHNPRILTTYTKNEDTEEYHIPAYGI